MSKKSNDVVITSALRTPIGAYKGSLKDLSAEKLGALAIKEVIHKSKLKSGEVDEVVMGHVLTSGLGQNPARQASIHAAIAAMLQLLNSFPSTITLYGVIYKIAVRYSEPSPLIVLALVPTPSNL